jgi:hypothetical protein
MERPEQLQLRETIQLWEDELIEGYWEVLDTASHMNVDQEKVTQYAALAQTCEETLQARWEGK